MERKKSIDIYKEEKINFKRCKYNSKLETNKQFGRMNQDVSGIESCPGRK